jgi:hypothetical protein|nr:MAG TPA: hypothetical protein [Caudoviricetes sp.]
MGLSIYTTPEKITDAVNAMYEVAVSAGLTYNEMDVVISKLKKLVDDSIGNKVL